MNENVYVSIRFNNQVADVMVTKLLNEKIHLLCCKSFALEGYFEGKIEDEDLFTQSIQNIVLSLSEQYKIDVDELIVTLPSYNLKIYSAEVQIMIKTAEQIISINEINKARNECKNVKINENDDELIVDENPLNFILDDGRVFRTAPINYSSSYLKLKSYVYTLPMNFIESLYNVFTKLNITMLAGYVQSFLPYELYVEDYATEDGLVIVNFDEEAIDISLFYKEQLIGQRHLNKGLNVCINELSDVLNIDYANAKELFYTFFVADINRCTDININPNIKISEKRISGIVLNKLLPLKEKIDFLVNDLLESQNISQCSKLLSGMINDIDSVDSVFVNYKLGIINKIGLVGNRFNNLLGAIYRYLRLNSDVIKNILEDDDKPHFKLNDDSMIKTDDTSRFKDIFDEDE